MLNQEKSRRTKPNDLKSGECAALTRAFLNHFNVVIVDLSKIQQVKNSELRLVGV